jgi:1,5-anhydro-D-fructose reductase (1,5-anhydro-D-mannitol-forming)
MLSPQLKGRTEVRWGIIGCGDVTEVKSGPGFQKAAGTQLVAVMRRNAALAADYARRHGVPRWYDDAEALIQDAEVDAVYIATHPETHAHYAGMVAAAGKPAYVEKPMARHAAECDRMIEAFARAQQKLFVAFYRRCLPRFVQVKQLLSEGALGQPTEVRCHWAAPNHRDAGGAWRLDAAKSGGGLFLDLGSHVLDLLDHLFGPLTNVTGMAANLVTDQEVEDHVAMSFVTAPGVPGTAVWNFASAARDDLLEISGTEGRLTCSVFGNEALRLEDAAGGRTLDRPNPPHVQQPLIQTVVDDLLGRGTCPSTGESARRTSRVMDTVLSAYYGGRDDEFWRRPETWPGRRRAPALS